MRILLLALVAAYSCLLLSCQPVYAVHQVSAYYTCGADEGPCSRASCNCIPAFSVQKRTQTFCLNFSNIRSPCLPAEGLTCAKGQFSYVSQQSCLMAYYDPSPCPLLPAKMALAQCTVICNHGGADCHQKVSSNFIK